MSDYFIYTEKGYCYYNFNYNGDKPIIYGLYIEKECRRQGNAQHLLELVIAEIRRKGFNDKIFAQAEPREKSIDKETLIKFYENMGLTVYEDDGGIRCKDCISSGDCKREDVFRTMNVENGFCKLGKMKEGSRNEV